MKKYFLRAASYLVFLVILVAIMYLLMYRQNIRELDLSTYFSNSRNIMMWAAIVAISLAYPLFGYVKREVKVNTPDPKETIKKVMDLSGFYLANESDDTMTFRARGAVKKVAMFFQDTITVTFTAPNKAVLDGKRKEVATIAYKAESFLI